MTNLTFQRMLEISFQEIEVLHDLTSKFLMWPGLKWAQHEAVSDPFETSAWVPKTR